MALRELSGSLGVRTPCSLMSAGIKSWVELRSPESPVVWLNQTNKNPALIRSYK